MSNLSILERNIIDGIDCDISSKAFLRARDHAPIIVAEKYAYEVRQLLRFLDVVMGTAASLRGLERVPDGLLGYILERHFHWRFPVKGAAA